MKKSIVLAVCVICALFFGVQSWAQSSSPAAGQGSESAAQSGTVKVTLRPGEKINRMVYNTAGTAMAFVVIKEMFVEEYFIFKGTRYGPYESVSAEAVSDDGTSFTYFDSPLKSKKTVYHNGNKRESWDCVEYLIFIPGTNEISYKGSIFNGDGSTANTLVYGTQKEGPYVSLDFPVFSRDGKHHAYRAKDDTKWTGNYYVHVDGKRLYGPYENVTNVKYGSGDAVIYTAEIAKKGEAIFVSGKKIAEAQKYFMEYEWNSAAGVLAYGWNDDTTASVTDGVTLYGPYPGRFDDLAFSPDYTSFSFGIVRADGGGVDVYKDGVLEQTVPSLCNIIYSPDGKDTAYSTAVLGGSNSLYYRGARYPAYESMLFNICFAAGKEVLAFRTQIKEQNYIMTTNNLRWGPFRGATEPVCDPSDPDTISFTAFDGSAIGTYSYKVR